MFTRHVKISCGLTLTALLLTPCIVSAQNIIKAGEKTAVAVEKTVKAAQESAEAAATKAVGTVTVRVKAEVPAGAATSPVVTSSKFPTTSEVKSSVPQSAAKGLKKTELKAPSALAQSAEVPTSAGAFTPTVSQGASLHQAIGTKVSNMATTEEVIEFKQELPTTAQLKEIVSKLTAEGNTSTVIKTADPEFDVWANKIMQGMVKPKGNVLFSGEVSKILKYPQLTECAFDAHLVNASKLDFEHWLNDAVENGYSEAIPTLVKNGADVNPLGAYSYSQDSYLMKAVRKGDVPTANALMESGADKYFRRGDDDHNALHVAVDQGDLPMVKALNKGKVPVTYGVVKSAISHENPEILDEILQNARTGEIPFMEYYAFGSFPETRFWSSLETPVKNGWEEHVRLLLDYGATPDVRIETGLTLVETARSHPEANYQRIADMLEQRIQQLDELEAKGETINGGFFVAEQNELHHGVKVKVKPREVRK